MQVEKARFLKGEPVECEVSKKGSIVRLEEEYAALGEP